MSDSVLRDAFAHHVWATLRVIDACLALRPEHLDTAAPGTYGTILDTVRHVCGADCWYLHRLTGGQTPVIDADELGLAELRAVIERNGGAWSRFIAADLDPDTPIAGRRDDGSEVWNPLGVRLAQALHHGTDHRSQICTALTLLGLEPPGIDLWDFAEQDGRLTETPASP